MYISRPSRHGFTLIELLVVISIIAVLIAILLPTLRMARATAQSAQCLSQVRQLGQLTYIYTSNNDGYFPKKNNGLSGANVQTWRHKLQSTMTGRMVKGPLGDPTNPNYAELSPIFACPSRTIDKGQVQYAGGPKIFVGNNADAYRMDVVRRGSEVIAIADAGQRANTGMSDGIYGHQTAATVYYDPGAPSNADPLNPGLNADQPTNPKAPGLIRWRHNGNEVANLWFLDGHAESRRPDQVLKGDLRPDKP